jgi:DNA-binding transcriptional ArsR family regulator
MNQLQISFIDTRARSTDGKTSRDAAKNAVSQKAAATRRAILEALAQEPMTAREISKWTGIDYYEVQRRMSETAGIEKTTEPRDGGYIWRLA